MPIKTEETSSRPTISASALFSSHERSTTVAEEHSKVVRSPSTPDEPRTYHASNTQELAVLMSASKAAGRKLSRLCEGTVARSDPAGTKKQKVEPNTPSMEQGLRDRDKSTISIGTAREMMRNQDAPAPMISKTVYPSVFNSSDDRRVVQARYSLSKARSLGRPEQRKMGDTTMNIKTRAQDGC